MEKKLKLPIGIENFSELRKRNYYYVDKTELIEQVLEDGSQVQALGFVLERHLPSYAGNLSDGVLSQVLANANGRYGTTRDYVEQTVSALRSHAMPDLNLEARLRRCMSFKP